MISALKKFKGRSLAELTERGRQSVSSLAERFGVSMDLRSIDEESLVRLFDSEGVQDSVDLLSHFTSRDSQFYPSMLDRDSAILAFRSNFPEGEESLLLAAEKICDAKFDLLGYHDLDFGRPVPDWFLEPVTGKRSPRVHWSQIDELDTSLSGDKKIVWELNRHQYFTVLGRAYWLTGSERFAEVFVAHLQDWIAENPPKIGINWRSSLEIAFRSISWIWAFYFFRSSPVFTRDLFAEMLKVLYLNGRHLERHLSTYSSPNTHLTGEALGLYALGTFLEGSEPGDRWKAKGRSILLDALKFQFRGDGGYVEQATQYHRYSADFYLSFFIWELSAGEPIDTDFRETLRKLLNFLLHLTQPDRKTTLIGDDDGGRLHFLDDREFSDFRSTLALGALVFDDVEMKYAAGDASEELLWLAGPEGLERYNQMAQTKPQERVAAFRESGFFVGRDGWERDSSLVLIKCGEHGFLNGAHAHADALGFVLSVKGMPVFVDSGTYNYTADHEARDHYRSTAAHNCAYVNGRSSSQPDGPFSWKTKAISKLIEWKAENGSIFFHGTHDGFEDLGVKYEREISIDSWTSMTLIDRFETFSKNHFNVTFILAPEVEAELVDRTRVVLYSKGRASTLLTLETEVLNEEADGLEGWIAEATNISPRYGFEVETTRLTFAVSAGRPFEVRNRFVFV